MDSSYTNPYGSQPSVPNGGQMQPADFPSQGDIILTPDRPRARLDKKRILILAGVGFVVLMLFVLVIMNIVNNRNRADTATVKKIFNDNYECIDQIESVFGETQSVASYLSLYSYREMEYCAEQLSAIKEDIRSLGNWSNEKISTSEFNIIRTRLLDYIESAEQGLPIYKQFVSAYSENDPSYIEEYLAEEETETEESEEGSGDEYNPLDSIRTAAAILGNYMSERNRMLYELELAGCNQGLEFSDTPQCESLAKLYNDASHDLISATSVANYLNNGLGWYIGNKEMIYPKVLLIINKAEE